MPSARDRRARSPARTTAWSSHNDRRTGVTEEEQAYATADSQSFYGPDMLVAPVTSPGATASVSVWFPRFRTHPADRPRNRLVPPSGDPP
ncbi:hypothetical protein [Streptomyces phaeochromogenes]|uniref:hypothetical protein n=1 Tax=Streptomyces phaeochromogenes TaxID=1923 RepID=UPI003CCC21C4